MESKITLKIGGMTCASCASVIEHGLKKEKGINSASVNLASEKAYIDFDKEKISENLEEYEQKYKRFAQPPFAPAAHGPYVE